MSVRFIVTHKIADPGAGEYLRGAFKHLLQNYFGVGNIEVELEPVVVLKCEAVTASFGIGDRYCQKVRGHEGPCE